MWKVLISGMVLDYSYPLCGKTPTPSPCLQMRLAPLGYGFFFKKDSLRDIGNHLSN